MDIAFGREMENASAVEVDCAFAGKMDCASALESDGCEALLALSIRPPHKDCAIALESSEVDFAFAGKMDYAIAMEREDTSILAAAAGPSGAFDEDCAAAVAALMGYSSYHSSFLFPRQHGPDCDMEAAFLMQHELDCGMEELPPSWRRWLVHILDGHPMC